MAERLNCLQRVTQVLNRVGTAAGPAGQHGSVSESSG